MSVQGFCTFYPIARLTDDIKVDFPSVDFPFIANYLACIGWYQRKGKRSSTNESYEDLVIGSILERLLPPSREPKKSEA